MVWSGSRPACLPLPFICLPVLFICLPGWVPVSHFHLFPTSFHVSPTSSPTSFHLSPRLGACGRVFGWLVSHFFSHVSQSLSICLPGWVLVVGFPAGLSPTSFHLSPTSFHLSPTSFQGFPAGLSPSQAGCLWSGSRLACLPSFHMSPSSFHLSPRLGACSRCRLACLPLPFICLPLLFICLPLLFNCLPVLFIVSRAGFLWSGSRLACLPLPFTGWVLAVRLVSHFLAFVFHFSPNSLLLGVLNSSLRCVRPLCHCSCSPISTGHVAFLFICLPGLSLRPPFSVGHGDAATGHR